MNKRLRNGLSIAADSFWRGTVCLVLSIQLLVGYNALADPSVEVKGPKFIFALTLNEFSVLNVSEMDGLLKYGGSADFKFSMAKVANEVVWTVTIDSPRLMELLSIFLGERTIKLIQGLDPENIDSNQKIALTTIKSLTAKLEAAQRNPVWDSIKLSGVVEMNNNHWLLKTGEKSFKLTGDNLTELQSQKGKVIVADGFRKKPGEFEVTRFIEKRENTLELFVMSFCPFGQRAETSVLEYLAKATANPKPNLDVHYIFYKVEKDGKDAFASLHGVEEIIENLVQIVIRDSHPEFFHAYLQLRAGSGETPWKELTGKLGFSPDESAGIERLITTRREEIIRKEYEYATGRYDIKDSSPTYVWESERVPNLEKIEAFKGLAALNGEPCAH